VTCRILDDTLRRGRDGQGSFEQGSGSPSRIHCATAVPQRWSVEQVWTNSIWTASRCAFRRASPFAPPAPTNVPDRPRPGVELCYVNFRQRRRTSGKPDRGTHPAGQRRQAHACEPGTGALMTLAEIFISLTGRFHQCLCRFRVVPPLGTKLPSFGHRLRSHPMGPPAPVERPAAKYETCKARTCILDPPDADAKTRSARRHPG
jgi:hypothetical protein